MAATIITALLALWLAFAATGLAGAVIFAHQARRFGRMRFPLPAPPPAVAVIVPVKGADPLADQCLRSLLDQDYRAYRLIVAVESESDPAHALAQRLAAERDVARVTIVVAGLAERRGQKVHNLLAALAATTEADEILCFADADTLWSPATLSTIVRELAAWDKPVLLSAYRWMYPTAPDLGSAIAAAANLPVAAVAKSPRWDLAWGGSMAARRSTLLRADLAQLWDRSLSDDVPLSGALRRAGASVKVMPNLPVPSPGAFPLAGAFAFARRQYAMLRLYAPRHWLFSFAVYTVFFAGLGASVAAIFAPQSPHVYWMAGVAWTLMLVRGLVHAAIGRRLLPRSIAARLRWALVLDTLLPLAPALLHGYGLLSTVRVRAVRWAGIAYGLAGKSVGRVERS